MVFWSFELVVSVANCYCLKKILLILERLFLVKYIKINKFTVNTFVKQPSLEGLAILSCTSDELVFEIALRSFDFRFSI
jgi:hypothetical protein